MVRCKRWDVNRANCRVVVVMNVATRNGYPKFAHYRGYRVTVDGGTIIDFSDQLPSDNTYLIGWRITTKITLFVSSFANDTVSDGGLYAYADSWMLMYPILVRTLTIRNTDSSAHDAHFLLAWN